MRKETCEEHKDLSTTSLKRLGYLQPHYVGGEITWRRCGEVTGRISILVDNTNSTMRCTYTSTTRWNGESEDLDYSVDLTTTPCYFGGVRYWFTCPLVKDGIPCRRRVGSLYLADKYFGCRHCYDLAYESQQETHTGYFGALGKLFKAEGYLMNTEVKYKYWKGRPTKRYLRYLKRLSRYEGSAPRAEELEMMLRNKL